MGSNLELRMPPVACYICGREFGSKSIGIHVPNCRKKWEAEQLKLPKKDRKAVPEAPGDFEKVVKGEIKGKEAIKITQKILEEHNDNVLEPCQHCKRTFKPSALTRHQKSCTEDQPMVKKKTVGHASQLKAKVNYPKVKGKSAGKNNRKGSKENKKDDTSKILQDEVKKESVDTLNLAEKQPITVVAKPPLLAGGSSKIHGVFAYFQKDGKDYSKSGHNETENEIVEETSVLVNSESHDEDNEHTKEEAVSSTEEVRSGQEEEWILVNPLATREFLDDVKQKILQCVNSSASSEKSMEEEEDNLKEDSKESDRSGDNSLLSEKRFKEEQEENTNEEIKDRDRGDNNRKQAHSQDVT